MKLPAPDLSPLARIVFEAYLKAMANANQANTPIAPVIDASKGKVNGRFIPRRGTVSTGPSRLAMPPSAATVAVNLGIVLVAAALPGWIETFTEAHSTPDPEISREHKQELMMLGKLVLQTTENTNPYPARALARQLKRRKKYKGNKGNKRFRIFGHTRAPRGSTLAP